MAYNADIVGKVALSIISALMSALLTFVFAIQGERQVFNVKLSDLSIQISHLTAKLDERTDDRYRGSDARRDFDKVSVQIEANASQIKELQELVRRHAEDRQVHK